MKKYNPITPQMNKEQLKEFCSKPYLMDIATLTKEGYPHVTPVWFDYDGEHFLVSTLKERQKAKNLQRNSKVGFSIAEPHLPFGAVIGYGDTTIIEDPQGELCRKLTYKYISLEPNEDPEEYFKELMERGSRIIVKIKPKWLLSWTG